MGRLGAKDARPLGSGGGYAPPKDRGEAGGNKIGRKFLRGLRAFLTGSGEVVSGRGLARPPPPAAPWCLLDRALGLGRLAAGGGVRRPLALLCCNSSSKMRNSAIALLSLSLMAI